MITSDMIKNNPVVLYLSVEDFKQPKIFLKVDRFYLKESEHSGFVELVLLDDDGAEMSGMDLRDPQTVEALRRENAKRPIIKASGTGELIADQMISAADVTRLWVKEGYTHQDGDKQVLVAGGDGDYHPENVQKNTEVQVIRDGEIVKRMWWVR